MASQQVLFAETIAGMKKAFKRRLCESDSDSEIDYHSNRGHKLKKRGRFARRGQLLPSAGPSAYKEEIEYAGVRRSILHRNPPLVDEDGYQVFSEEEPERVKNALGFAAELNPYADIRLERTLAPLTAATALSSHPTLSRPFISKTLTELVEHSCSLMRKENQSLWEVRRLWTSLYGDNTWIPCELMIGDADSKLYKEDSTTRPPELVLAKSRTAAANGDNDTDEKNKDMAKENGDDSNGRTNDGDVSMVNVETSNGTWRPEDSEKHKEDGKNGRHDTAEENKERRATSADGQEAQGRTMGRGEREENAGEKLIHPLFLPPSNARPDRNLGLPASEADDIRRLLALYVQKQEEVCRGTVKLHGGLLRAQRLRSEVLHWAKAEAHCGPNRDMSDGEDWYDKEEWELDEDLKKGQDEEEEDTTTQGKKTRNRR